MKAQRYVMIRGQIYRWEEKAPFVKSGKSVRGAVEVNPETKEAKCHECGKWFRSVGRHVNKTSRISRRRCIEHSRIDAQQYKAKHGLRMRAPIGFSVPGNRNLPRMSRPHPFPKSVNTKKRPHVSHEMENEKNICPPQIITRIAALAAELGHAPTREDAGIALSSAAIKKYGTWNNAVREARVEPNLPGPNRPRFSHAMMLEPLRDFYVLNQRLPHRSEFGGGRLPSVKTYERFFGTLREAFGRAGLGLVYANRRKPAVSDAAD